jgi:ABC-2 type transport system permease protein
MSERKAFWATVARREIIAKLTDRAFLVGTLLTIGLITAFMVVQGLLADRTQTFTVTSTSADSAMVSAAAKAAHSIDDKVTIVPVQAADEAAARQALADGTANAWLHKDGQGWVLTGQDGLDGSLTSTMSAAISQQTVAANAHAAGTSIEAIMQGSQLRTTLLSGSDERQGVALVMGFALSFLFYMASVFFGYTLAGSVVEEKASRIVEIIATKIPVRQLLAGKIIGNGVLALGQMVIFVGIGLVGLSLTPYGKYLPSVSAGLIWFLVFFLVGFLLIACMWAVAGSLASRSEDLQSTGSPLTMLMMAIFFSSFLAKGSVLTALSVVPPFSAILMPMRILGGSVPWWQPVLSLVLLTVTCAVVVLLAERLYRRSLLQTQGKLGLRQAWRTEE